MERTLEKTVLDGSRALTVLVEQSECGAHCALVVDGEAHWFGEAALAELSAALVDAELLTRQAAL
jgi:hypothetical protein